VHALTKGNRLIQDIIAKQEEEGMILKEIFNNVTGWGQVIKPLGLWRSLQGIRNGGSKYNSMVLA
jgi:hypothetical protein